MPRPLKARYPLLLILVGWAGSAFAVWASDHYVRSLLAACQDSPGIPLPGLAAGWAGLAVSAAGTVWVLRDLTAFARQRLRPFRWTNGALFALLPLVVVVLLLQVIALQEARGHAGFHRDPCFGIGQSAVQER
jgi:hypothetical protein